MKTILAIDPGMSGGIAWKIASCNPAAVPMPETERDICDMIHSAGKGFAGDTCVAYVEDVPKGMPNRGAAMVKLNYNAGLVRGILTAMDVKIVAIRPAVWQKHFSLGTRAACKSDTEWKNKLKGKAQQLFPGIKVTLKTADSLLLLEYAIHQEK